MNSNIFQKNLLIKIQFLATITLLIVFSVEVYPFTVSNLAFGQDANETETGNIDNNITGLNIVEPNVTLNTDKGGEVVGSELIVLLKQPQMLSPDMALTLEDPVTSVTNDVEDQGFEVNNTRVLTGINALVLTIDSPEISFDAESETVSGIPMTSNVTEEQSLENLINNLEKNPLVEAVETNKLMVAHQSSQVITKGLDRIDGEPNLNSDTVDVDVAIMDTGIDADHPDLNVPQDKQVNFIGSSPNDNCGHGTHVGGIVGAKDNDIGIVGVAPGAKLWNVKVLEYNPSIDRCSGPLTDIIEGLNYVAENSDEIDVVNLSLGGYCPASTCDSRVYEEAINRVADRGVVVVTSAGNSNDNTQNYVPARFLSSIAVSAISDTDGKCGALGPISEHPRGGPDDTLADFSNFGSAVDIAAPGVDILSTYPDNSYAVLSGTSMAAPYVAGSAALIKSVNPTLSPSVINNLLLEIASNFKTECNNASHGYFNDDRDGFPEPLLNVQQIN
jgi:subtilisin family serine protease